MKYLGGDSFMCENCGHTMTTSWGDCRVPTCNVCKGEKGFVERILGENEKMRKKLEKYKKIKRQI